MNSECNLEVAEILLNIGALSLSTTKLFTYASGLKGPIYCDNRLLLSHPRERRRVVELFVEKIKDEKLHTKAIVGIATAGIPHAALVADQLNVPTGYIRGKSKEHGKQLVVEGGLQIGSELVVIEDLVNQGKSSVQAILSAREEGFIVNNLFCIVDYFMPSAENLLKTNGIKLISLTNFHAITDKAGRLNLISESDKKELLRWHENPQGYK